MTTAVAGIVVERDAEAVLRDGTILRADVFRPAEADEPRPVLLLRTPYGKDLADAITYLHPAWYVRHGFIVAIQDVRGTGASDGDFTPFIAEGADGYDSVEWAGALDGSNGRVGMYGASYPGLVQLQAAVERPPSLGAICPAVTSADLYSHWTYEGGALNLAFVSSWALLLALQKAIRAGDTELAERISEKLLEPKHWYGSAAPAALAPLDASAPWYLEWLAHPTKDDWWRSVSPEDRLDRVAVPALHIGGWYDIFASGTVAAFRQLVDLGKDDQHLLLGPWAHYPWGLETGELRSGPEAVGSVRIDEAQLRFFRRHLTDPEAGEPQQPTEPTVRYFPIYAGGWRDATSWPPDGASERALYLASEGQANGAKGEGRLADEPAAAADPDVYNYLQTFPVPSLGGHSCCFPERVPMGMADQTPIEDLPQVLVYTSDVLVGDLFIAGDVRAHLWIANDAESADYVARLCVADEDGSWNIAEGIRRVTSEPGADAAVPREVIVSLGSVAADVEAGKRLRLHVTSGSMPMWSANPQDGSAPEGTAPADGRPALHAVYHDREHPSRITFHVVDGDGGA